MSDGITDAYYEEREDRRERAKMIRKVREETIAEFESYIRTKMVSGGTTVRTRFTRDELLAMTRDMRIGGK